MILFGFSNYEQITRQLTAASICQSGHFAISRFDNQELCAFVQQPISGEHCLILGSIAPPDEQALSFMLLAHTLKKEGANKLTAVLPYLAYSRQDKFKPGESLATAWIGSLLKVSGVDQVLTVDVHSERDRELFSLPLISLSTADLFASVIKKYGLGDATIVAPDNGAISRCEAVKNAAGMPVVATPYFEKTRTERGVVHRGPIGNVGSRVVIIDDILDTGGTLISACEKLIAAKVEEIYVLVTHGLFTGSDWKRLQALNVRKIFCTDTVPLHRDFEPMDVSVLSVVPILQEGLSSLTGKGTQRAIASG
jgi:ribose-phosphate pyrophosphokinase